MDTVWVLHDLGAGEAQPRPRDDGGSVYAICDSVNSAKNWLLDRFPPDAHIIKEGEYNGGAWRTITISYRFAAETLVRTFALIQRGVISQPTPPAPAQ